MQIMMHRQNNIMVRMCKLTKDIMNLQGMNVLPVRRYFNTSAFHFASPHLSKFATVDPFNLSAKCPYKIQNLVKGEWRDTKHSYDVIDPLNGEPFVISPNTLEDELHDFVSSLREVPKSGRHNPFKNSERYLMYGRVFQKVAALLHEDQIFQFFVKCIQRTMPKSYSEAASEVSSVRKFCENYSGDSVRFCVRGFVVPGDHASQMTCGFRFPYGGVCVISPFNFPLKLPSLQMLGAAMVGNFPLVKTEATQALCVEQFLRFLHYCGLPKDEIDLINTRGPIMSKLIEKAKPRMVQFTGSSRIADELSILTKGRIKIEDGGFDWKILGGDVSEFDFVTWQCDQDAYALSGQKCSAQSMLFAHTNWMNAGLVNRLKYLASRRSLSDLSCSPILSLTNKQIQQHIDALLEIEGSHILFGGGILSDHSIPSNFGSFEPTAIFVPLNQILKSRKNYDLITTEIFAPIQIVTEWGSSNTLTNTNHEDEKIILEILDQMNDHLTAAIVSKDIDFINRMIGGSVNGTTFVGIKSRTTGAPQNHWFGPSSDPRQAGIATPEGILYTWTCHREIIYDHGGVSKKWEIPKPS